MKKLYMFSISSFITGLTMGNIITKKYLNKKQTPIGILRIDKSEKEIPPRLFLELEAPIEILKHSNYVTFKVVDKSYISQK